MGYWFIYTIFGFFNSQKIFMKPFIFQTSTFYAEEMKHQLDYTYLDYIVSHEDSEKITFSIEIQTPDDRDLIRELERQVITDF